MFWCIIFLSNVHFWFHLQNTPQGSVLVGEISYGKLSFDDKEGKNPKDNPVFYPISFVVPPKKVSKNYRFLSGVPIGYWYLMQCSLATRAHILCLALSIFFLVFQFFWFFVVCFLFNSLMKIRRPFLLQIAVNLYQNAWNKRYYL